MLPLDKSHIGFSSRESLAVVLRQSSQEWRSWELVVHENTVGLGSGLFQHFPYLCRQRIAVKWLLQELHAFFLQPVIRENVIRIS